MVPGLVLELPAPGLGEITGFGLVGGLRGGHRQVWWFCRYRVGSSETYTGLGGWAALETLSGGIFEQTSLRLASDDDKTPDEVAQCFLDCSSTVRALRSLLAADFHGQVLHDFPSATCF